MSAPLCPALLAAKAAIALPIEDGRWFEYTDLTAAPGVACLGSRCAKWIPAGAIPAPNAYTATTPPPRDLTRGCCSDNPFAEPWADPAAPKGGGS